MRRRASLLLILFVVIGLIGCTVKFENGTSNKEQQSLFPAYKTNGMDKKWGYINKTGDFVIKPQFDAAENFMENGLAKVKTKDMTGLINRDGKIVNKFEYADIGSYQNGIAIAYKYDEKQGYRYSILNATGKAIFSDASDLQEFSEGLATFSYNSVEKNHTYGYVDRTGKVVVEPKYKMAGQFSNGKALVKNTNDCYELIDKKGKVIRQLQYTDLYDLKDNIICYKDGDLYGFISANDGNIIVAARFSESVKFHNSLAIVCDSKSDGKYGVIDTKGNYVIPPEYMSVGEIGDGLFAVCKYKKDTSSWDSDYYKKAIFDKSGKQLTDYKYYNIEMIHTNELSVADEKKTYLIDRNGNKIQPLKSFDGFGTITKPDGIYRIDIDENLYYFDEKGKQIWKGDDTVDIGNGIKVRSVYYRPNRFTRVRYPELNGMADADVQSKLNKELRQYFVKAVEGSEVDIQADDYMVDASIGYSFEHNKDLLIITLDGYDYPIGAAHGQPYKQDFHINLQNGKIYKLNQLFQKDSGYEKKLIDKIRKIMIKNDKEAGGNLYLVDNKDELELGSFYINKDSLCIYYAPYEIACYAAGFQFFYIPYEEIMDLIDTNGEFWNSFDRDSHRKSPEAAQAVSDKDKNAISSFMNGYEQNIISAINNNDFEAVKPWLYEDGDLYKSQMKLVSRLNTKGIKESLDGFTIDRIEMNDEESVYRIFVDENISINYPGKGIEKKHYKWVYSAVYSYNDKKYKLTYLEKWDGQ